MVGVKIEGVEVVTRESLPALTGVPPIDRVLDELLNLRGAMYDTETRFRIASLLMSLEQAIKAAWVHDRRAFQYTWTCSPIDASFHIEITEEVKKR